MSLQAVLSRTDMTAPAIQASAGAMMRHYDRSAGVAVNEWRNGLQTCRQDQLLPLLYVANEVLQNSKRNRGNKFLEAFAPILGQALQFICQKNPGLTEKVRRTAKIWGDRVIFSPRFVGELLRGVEPYRNKGNSSTPQATTTPPQRVTATAEVQPKRVSPSSTKKVADSSSIDDLVKMDDGSDDEDESDDDQADDDGSSSFLGNDSSGLLDVQIDLSGLAKSAEETKASKRRRSSVGGSGTKSKRRKSVLSTTSLVDLWNQLSSYSQSMETTLTILGGLDDQHMSTEGIESLVGDDLVDAYRQVMQYEKTIQDERKNLHKIANGRRALEKEAVRYIPWCRQALGQDDEELALCDQLETEIKGLQRAQQAARKARDIRKEKEARAREEEEKERHRQEEEEERKRMLEDALRRQDIAEEGMVWNSATQEYQRLNTEETWRD
eukprot:CAMPEP_0194031374 /NCGR_PEP_ID=MMETSP0009_2-20130614/4560_1 /TAXON_ID=210454 /ORGANISM="Grammatophora oceanica, Strain CCMP 410" /LENGTH=438 /DNA_ID=CAMNT_0038671515 /DNA_START=138 /DNA_END=1454 /DNA_ORIENTATION=-